MERINGGGWGMEKPDSSNVISYYSLFFSFFVDLPISRPSGCFCLDLSLFCSCDFIFLVRQQSLPYVVHFHGRRYQRRSAISGFGYTK
jgi:hypothetical protein